MHLTDVSSGLANDSLARKAETAVALCYGKARVSPARAVIPSTLSLSAGAGI
jgi:hypothetical protein